MVVMRVMPGPDYIKGLSDGFALALAVIKGSRDVKDAIRRVEAIRDAALERAAERLVTRRMDEVMEHG